jgi:hypothetical protein
LEELFPIFQIGVEKGLTLWDTAAVYGMGASETILGECLKHYENVTLSTNFRPLVYRAKSNDTTEQYTVNMLTCNESTVVSLNATSDDHGQITFDAALPATIDTGDGLTIQVETTSGNRIGSRFTYPVIDECFIATVAFDSKLQPAVVLLRQFRDKILLKNIPGQKFVAL